MKYRNGLVSRDIDFIDEGAHVRVMVTVRVGRRSNLGEFTVSKGDIARLQHGLLEWMRGALIQDALPWLSDDQREILLSGMGPKNFNVMLGDDDEEDPSTLS